MAAGRAGPARRPLHPGRRAEADQAVEHRQAGHASPRAMSRPASSEAEVIDRAALYDQAGAPGLYRAACLRRLGRRRRADARSGARARASSWCAPTSRQAARHRHRQYPRDPGRDRRRVRRQDARLSRAGRLALSKKSGRPVKIVMSREEVFRATGPAAGARHRGQARRQEGRHASSPPNSCVKYQAGAFPGSPVGPGCMCGFAMYDIPNVNIVGYDVVSQPAEGRRLSRARRAELDSSAIESCIDELARELEHRPARAARDQRRQGRHQGGARADLGQYRLPADARGGEGARAPEDAARARTRGAASPRASGSISAASRARPCTSTRTAPPASSRATPISAARAPRWR